MIRVRIEWNDDGDWPWFWLMKVKGQLVKLKGADYPDGSAAHIGDKFWVDASEIKRMEYRVD